MTQDPNITEPATTPALDGVPDPEPAGADAQEWDADKAAAAGVPGDVVEPEHDAAATDPSNEDDEDTAGAP